MRVGLIARADDTGLGVQTHEFYRHMNPAKTLVIDLSHVNRKKNFYDRYPDAEVLKHTPYPETGGTLQPETKTAIDSFLEDLDVVFTCETVYDYYLISAAKARGVKVVLQYNFELLDHVREPKLPRPDLFMAPSLWRYDDVKAGPKVFLPVPVDREKIPAVPRTEAKTFLHVGGNPAMEDRNGTQVVIDAWDWVKSGANLIVRSQTGNYRTRNDKVKVMRGSLPNYSDLYTQGDVFILPRKFGGLCLPLNEALSAAMPIVMTDLSPQNEFLPRDALIPAEKGKEVMTKMMIDVFEPNKGTIAETVDMLNGNPTLVQELSERSDRIADTISWKTLKPLYEDTFAQTVEGREIEQMFSWS